MGYVVKNRELGIEPDEAEGIRKIFDIFLMTKSPTEMAKMLPRMGMLSKQRTTKNGRVIVGKALNKSGLYKILQNPIYIGKINSSYMSRILRLNQLAPQIKKAILADSQPRQLSLQDMQTPFPELWEEQLKHFGFVD